MAEINKIKSFKSFSEVIAQEKAIKEAELNVSKRQELTNKIAALLDEMNITSFEDLDEEVKKEFITKAFGEVSEDQAEDIEAEINKEGEPENVEKDLELEDEGDAEGEEIAEGNAFIYAAAKARQEGKDEFEFNGKTYKVTLKKDTGLKESEEINEGKRENGKVVTAWKKSGLTDLNTIAKVYADAMEDANFHQEMVTSKAIGAASKSSKTNVDASDISAAAGWSGYAIANGTVQYLNMIGEEGAASKLLAAITKFDLNESAELPMFIEDTLITEAKYDKKKLLKAIKNLDDATITVKGKEYIIYNPDNNNDENTAMWGALTIVALDQDGEEHSFEYSEIEGFSESVVIEAADDFAGWIAFFNGKKLEITKDEAKDLWGAKQLAIKKLNVPKSKQGLLAIAPAVEESVVNEAEVDIYDEVGGLIEDLYSKLNDLAEETTDSTWRKAIQSIIKNVEMVENNLGKASSKLGIVPVRESEEMDEASVVNEAEVKSDDEFKEYAFTVLQKAFGKDFDEAKAQEVVDGILGKVDGDYGAAVGMLTASLSESVSEKKADGTISDDEDERREELMSQVEVSIDDLLAMIKKEANDIGGSFRSPGIMYDAKKLIEDKIKKFK